jgi:aminotransferase
MTDIDTVPRSALRNPQLSDRVRRIPASGIRRFFDLATAMDGSISLGVGEPDFVSPWRIREAGIFALEQGATSYTSNYGLLELREEIAAHLARLYGVRYDPATEILVTVGVSEGIDLALRALINPGDEVIGPDPAYASYMPNTVLVEGVYVPVPALANNDFCIRPADIEAQITERTRAILFGFPANPTGAVMTREALAAIARLAERHNLAVLSDEIYDRLVYGVEHVCFAALPGARERTVLLGGFSKAYAMTGWRVGFAAAPAPIIEAMMKVHQYTVMCAPTVAQMAAIEALRSGEPDVQEMVREYDRRRRVMVARLNRMGLDCHEPRGAFYAFPSVGATGLTADQFAERLLFEEKVVVIPGTAFGANGEGYIRCCYATSLAEIEEAMDRMERFVGRLG